MTDIQIAKPVQWRGVVACQRTKADDMVKIVSPRSHELGARAISCEMPLSLVSDYFDDSDEEFVCAYAEFGGGHLQLYEKVPSPLFFKHPEQYIS
jgi:hypothetical protein